MVKTESFSIFTVFTAQLPRINPVTLATTLNQHRTFARNTSSLVWDLEMAQAPLQKNSDPDPPLAAVLTAKQLRNIMWSRSLRMLRFLRLMRMLRMVKLRRINEVFQEFFTSQAARLCTDARVRRDATKRAVGFGP